MWHQLFSLSNFDPKVQFQVSLLAARTWCVFMQALQRQICPLHLLLFHRLCWSSVVLLSLGQFTLIGKTVTQKSSSMKTAEWTHNSIHSSLSATPTFIYSTSISFSISILLFVLMTYQRDGNVLVGQPVFPPGIICQVQDSSVSLNFAVHHRRKPQIKECTSDILTNKSVALWLSDNTV